jgi:hypothetical protein
MLLRFPCSTCYDLLQTCYMLRQPSSKLDWFVARLCVWSAGTLARQVAAPAARLCRLAARLVAITVAVGCRPIGRSESDQQLTTTIDRDSGGLLDRFSLSGAVWFRAGGPGSHAGHPPSAG